MKRILIILLYLNIVTFARSQVLDHFICEDSLYSQPWGAGYVDDLKTIDGKLYTCGAGLSYGGSELLNRGIGYWDNSSWHNVDNSFEFNANIYCVEKYNGYIYVGGGFVGVDENYLALRCAKWDGISWHELNNSYGTLNSSVNAMTVYDDLLIIGGVFNSIGDEPFNFVRVAAYDGTDFINIGSLPEEVTTLKVYNGELYAGGWWTTLKKYIGGVGYSAWQDVGGHTNYYIQDMKVDTVNNFLLVAGGFTLVDDSIHCDYGIWDGFKWSGVGNGEGYALDAKAICLYHGDVFLGGYWDSIDGEFVGHCAFNDGEGWHKIESGIHKGVNCLEVYKDTLFIGQNWLATQGDSIRGTLARYYSPYDGNCRYLQPRVQSITDTFYMYSGEAEVQLYNNNAYVDSWDWDFGDSGTDNIKDPLHTYSAIGDYNVQVTITDGACIKTASKTIHVVLGDEIQEIINVQLKIFPNPSKNNFTVQTSALDGTNTELRITGLNGHTKTTIKVTSENTEINTTGWVKGTYICNLFVDGKLVKSEKLILN